MAQSQTRSIRSKGDDLQKADASAAYEVQLSKAAEAVYEGYYSRAAEARERGEATSAHYTALNMIDQAIDEIIPRDPFNKRYALEGNLSGIFRLKKGRMRICWIVSSNLKRAVVIFISETLRKAGDSADPYELIASMLMRGELTEEFEKLGLRPPLKTQIQRRMSGPMESNTPQ